MGIFDTSLEITFSGYLKADGSPLLPDEIRMIADHLRNSGFARAQRMICVRRGLGAYVCPAPNF